MGMVVMEATIRLSKESRRLTHQAIGVPMSKLKHMVQAARRKEIFIVVSSSGVRARDNVASRSNGPPPAGLRLGEGAGNGARRLPGEVGGGEKAKG